MAITKPIFLDETGKEINESLSAIKDAILNTETVQQGKIELQAETEKLKLEIEEVKATIPEDYAALSENVSQLSNDLGEYTSAEFHMGVLDDTEADPSLNRASTDFIDLRKGDVVYAPDTYVLALWYFDDDFVIAERPYSYELNIGSWDKKLVCERDGKAKIIAKKEDDSQFDRTEYLSENTKILHVNTVKKPLTNYDTNIVKYVYGYNDRKNGFFNFVNSLITSNRFYELNGDILSIVSDAEFFVIFYDKNYKTITDSATINDGTLTNPDNKYTLRWRYDVSHITDAKYIRIVTQAFKGLNALTKITSGVIHKPFNNDVIVAPYNSQGAENAEILTYGVDDREALQQALWLGCVRNSNVYLYEGDYVLNSIFNTSYPYIYNGEEKPSDMEGGKTCLFINHFKSDRQYTNPNRVFSFGGLTPGISYMTGARILLGEQLYNELGTDEVLSLVRGAYQSDYIEFDPLVVPVSYIKMYNLTFILPMNDKAITCIDLGYSHACDLSDVKCIAVKPEDEYDAYKPIPIANEKCYGIRGLMGSNWNVVNTFKNIEVYGFYIGFDISGEHCSVINASAKYNYYGFTFCYLQRYGANNHPITCMNMLDEHSVCLPIFGKKYMKRGQGIIILGYNLMFPAKVTQGDISYDDERHHKAIELDETGNNFGGIIYYTNNVDPTTGENGENVWTPAFFEKGGKAIQCVNMAHKKAHSTEGRLLLEPNYLQQVFDVTLNKLVIWNGEKWVDTNGNDVD